MPKLPRLFFAVPAVLALALTSVQAQQPAPPAPAEDYVRAHYTKYEPPHPHARR